MRINTNVAALNTYRQLTNANTNQTKSMEKLSSGLRINKAGDDAAGLAISEKMRGQIRGLDQAQRNAQDGISMIQTAEGALNESQSILQRMRELSVQSANDSNTAQDRQELQKEVDQLAEEITRISNNTEFNTQNLLNGGIDKDNLGDVKFQIGANKDQNLGLEISAMDASTLGVARDIQTATVSNTTDVTDATLSGTLGTDLIDGASLSLTADDTASTATTGAVGGMTLTTDNKTSALNGYTVSYVQDTTDGTATATLDETAKTLTIKGDFESSSSPGFSSAADITTAVNDALTGSTDTNLSSETVTVTGTAGTTTAGTSGDITGGLASDEVKLTIGTEDVIVKNDATSATFTSAENQGLTVNLDGAITGAAAATIDIGITTSSAATFAGDEKTADAKVAGGIDISSQDTANTAIKTINTAIESVSSERSKLGAYQNRLEYTVNNLSTSSENLTAAESRIRDVDMAKEIMNQTKNSILSQAAQAMLAQANQQPQGVLQLLR
ncbi:flagellin [Aquibacillus sp. 3ASR75-11]|uniref:Flagellin n=1 Tax=Terrihalobacillus insolitus TaxID=2950438 RepID=A0A9X3WSM0_9BACI|nr:flagellin [Terrihalobacillus insolitus]MDC3412230.1 flagellin [Terrihalobacillus insolitus]MDC3423076.1 flagellin [Terrihalobacillus insolitus]